MLQFRSLSQRLFFGYAAATLALIGFLVLFDEVTDFSLLTRLMVSLTLISLVFLIVSDKRRKAEAKGLSLDAQGKLAKQIQQWRR